MEVQNDGGSAHNQFSNEGCDSVQYGSALSQEQDLEINANKNNSNARKAPSPQNSSLGELSETSSAKAILFQHQQYKQAIEGEIKLQNSNEKRRKAEENIKKGIAPVNDINYIKQQIAEHKKLISQDSNSQKSSNGSIQDKQTKQISKSVSKALSIIDQLEKEVIEEEEVKKNISAKNSDSDDTMSFDQMNQQQEDAKEQKPKEERLSFSQSAIMAPEQSFDQKEGDESHGFADEETALLIDNINNPYQDYDPYFFSDQRKKQWLQDDQTFKNQFISNQRRFKDFDADYYNEKQRIGFEQKNYNFESVPMANSAAGHQNIEPNNFSINEEQYLMTEKLEKDVLYNVYGQRFHPNGNPNDYQHAGQNVYAAAYANNKSNVGNYGNKYQPPISYERKYNLHGGSQDHFEEFDYHKFAQNQQNVQQAIRTLHKDFKPILPFNSADDDTNLARKMRAYDSSETSQLFYDGFLRKGDEIGISTFAAFCSIMKQTVGFTILTMPVGVKELGIGGYLIAITYVFTINLYCVWLQSKSERKFRTEATQINSMADLTYLCFNDFVTAVFHLFRLLSIMAFLVSFNMYLGTETDQILCQSVRSYVCGKYDHLIRIAFNLLMLPLIFAGQTPYTSKIMQFFALITMVVGLVFITYHEYMIFRVDFLTTPFKKVEGTVKQVGLFPRENGAKSEVGYSLLKICSFISLGMTLFEQNTQLLQIKNEMRYKGREFMKISALAYVVTAIAIGVLAFFGQMAYGTNFTTPITDNAYGQQEQGYTIDQQLYFAAKMLCAFSIFVYFMVGQSDMFQSLDKISTLSISNTITHSHTYNLLSRLSILGIVIVLSLKLPQNIELLLQITGGFFGTILLILYPILVFNKVYNQGETEKYSWVRHFNWFIFMLSVTIGSVGIYEGIRHMKEIEVLILVN